MLQSLYAARASRATVTTCRGVATGSGFAADTALVLLVVRIQCGVILVSLQEVALLVHGCTSASITTDEGGENGGNGGGEEGIY